MKVADVRLYWTNSPSTDIVNRKVIVTVDGVVTTVEVGVGVSETLITINASTSASFKTVLTDSEGKEVSSVEYTFHVGDLIDPLPDTDLGHEIVAIREVDEPV